MSTAASDALAILLRARERIARAVRRFDRRVRQILRLRPRNPLDALLLAHEERMDAERREFAEAVGGVIRATQTRDGMAFDAFAYARVRFTLRPVFDEFYGRYPGDVGCRFGALMLQQTRAVRALAFALETDDIERHLQPHPDLLRAIKAEAA